MDDDLTDKRIFTQSRDTIEVVIAAAIGIVSVAMSDARVGEYGVVHRCTPTDLAAVGDTIVVATETDVLISDDGGFRETGFGPAVAVGGPDTIHAAGPDGYISRYTGGQWAEVGQVDAAVRAIDGDLVATADGLVRLTPELPHVGLDDVRDVAVNGRPLAATATGLYSLGNGWMKALDGDFRTAATDGDRAHAATDEQVVERTDGDWIPVAVDIDAPIVEFDYHQHVFAITVEGTLMVDTGQGFRAAPLGIPDVVGLAIRPPA